MGCTESKCCSLCKRNNRRVSFDGESTSSSSYVSKNNDNNKINIIGGNKRTGKQQKKINGGDSIFNVFISRNFLRGFRKNQEVSMSKIEITMKSAILIQRWYRRFLARMEIRRRYTWTIFQSIEYAGEQDQLKLYNFFNALLTHIPNTTSRPNRSSSLVQNTVDETLNLTFEDESDDEDDVITHESKTTYKGVHINFPLNKNDIDTLIDSFRRKKQHKLHARYVAEILKEATEKLKKMPNINLASTAISKQVTICGDLHGKLDDLLVVFHKNGLPSAQNPYIFNGDFVDRGKKGLEVLLLLLACMLTFPGGVFLNRGNHEDHIMNSRYGFIREIHSKYRRNGERILKLIEQVYRFLPLGTLVNNKVLVVHGGISDTTDLELIKSLDRTKYTSLLRPPILESAAPGAELINKVEWKQIFNLLWSDPQPSDGCYPNALRGAGTYFGPDVTKQFLEKHNLMFIVRSHECKIDGYEEMHNRKVITIFSASNYYELGSNKGAYLKLVGPDLDTHFVKFTSSVEKTKKLTFRERIGLVESSAIKELREHIVRNRTTLEMEFLKSDKDKSGFIKVSEWCAAMETSTGLNLPWRLLKDKLVTLDSKNQLVKYSTTFDKINDHDIINSAQSATMVVDTLYRNKTALETIFRIIDKDNSGYISLEEFSDACNLISEHMQSPITHDQLIEICKVMDMNKDGLVDLNEFLETFRLVDQDLNPNIQRINEELNCNNGKEINNKSPLSTSPIKIKTDVDEITQQEYRKKKLRRESLGIDKGDYNWEYTRTLAELQYQNVTTNGSDSGEENKKDNEKIESVEDSQTIIP